MRIFLSTYSGRNENIFSETVLFARETETPLVATWNTHYLHKEDKAAHRILYLVHGDEHSNDEYNHLYQKDSFEFVKNIEKQKIDKAFLITGGYHTQHVTELLRQKGYSYIVLTPHVSGPTNQKKYEQRLLEPLKGMKNKSLSFPQAFGGNPNGASGKSSDDARQKISGMTGERRAG